MEIEPSRSQYNPTTAPRRNDGLNKNYFYEIISRMGTLNHYMYRLLLLVVVAAPQYLQYLFLFKQMLNIDHNYNYNKKEASRDCLVGGSISTREDKIFTKIYISIYSLWRRGKARR